MEAPFTTTHPATDMLAELTALSSHHQETPPTAPRPVGRAERIQPIDLIRGLALLGILMMNVPGFGFLDSGTASAFKIPGSADYYTFTIASTAFEGTMRALFSMLFGAGMILFATNKQEAIGGPSVMELYYRRLLWLVAFGAFDAYILLWRGDVLYYYGLCGMLLFPFRRLKPGPLVLLFLLCVGIGLFKSEQWQGNIRTNRAGYLEAIRLEKAHKKPSEKQLEAKAAWEQFEGYSKPDAEKDAKKLKEMRSGYPTIFTSLMPENSGNEIWGMYHGCWDMLSMMFLGMALLGWGFFANKLSTQTYAVTLLVGYGLGLPISWYYVQFYMDWLTHPGQAVDVYRVFPMELYDLRRTLLALGHASLLLLVYRAGVMSWLMRALVAVGQMAFTNYLMQSIICTIFFFGYGFGNYGKLAYHQLYYVVGAIWVVQLIASPIWLRYFRFGPFEWLWRSLTYWQLQPMWARNQREI